MQYVLFKSAQGIKCVRNRPTLRVVIIISGNLLKPLKNFPFCKMNFLFQFFLVRFKKSFLIRFLPFWIFEFGSSSPSSGKRPPGATIWGTLA